MQEWPEFATSFLALGADEGGWDEALKIKLDLEPSGNQQEVEQDGLVLPYQHGRRCTG